MVQYFIENNMSYFLEFVFLKWLLLVYVDIMKLLELHYIPYRLIVEKYYENEKKVIFNSWWKICVGMRKTLMFPIHCQESFDVMSIILSE